MKVWSSKIRCLVFKKSSLVTLLIFRPSESILDPLTATNIWQDPNTMLVFPTRCRRNGVVTVLHSEFPDFTSTIEVHSLAVPGLYLVVRVSVDNTPIYIHNVYAPVERQRKTQFFFSLVTEELEANATHLVMGISTLPTILALTSRTRTCSLILVGQVLSTSMPSWVSWILGGYITMLSVCLRVIFLANNVWITY